MSAAGSGSIDITELGEAMEALGLEASRQQLQQIMSSVDTAHTGSISLKEFAVAMAPLCDPPAAPAPAPPAAPRALPAAPAALAHRSEPHRTSAQASDLYSKYAPAKQHRVQARPSRQPRVEAQPSRQPRVEAQPSRQLNKELDSMLREAFNLFDMDGSGSIDSVELADAMEALGAP